MLWDTAAAHCVVNEAGKGIFNFDENKRGGELRYDLNQMRNGWFVCEARL